MPTGYTAALYDGEKTFEDFALGCARAFGAALLMRDNSNSDPITVEAITEKGDYNAKGLRTARAELVRLRAMTPDQAAAEARSAYLDLVEFERNYKADKDAKRARYQAMLDEVREWEPPSEKHEEFKKFMIDQLTGSIDFDTSTKYDRTPVEQTGEEWLADRIAKAERDIEYHTEEQNKIEERNAGRVRWVNELRESLGLETLRVAS